MSYLVLLNESLLSTVVSMPTAERRRFREKLEFLRAGLWDTGVRVKRLKGLSRKVIFEARLNRGDRLLFTLGRDRERPLVYLWDLVSHDDVDRAARRPGASPAPFLSFEPESTEERPDLSLDDLKEDSFSQEPLEARVTEDHGPQRWLVLDDEEWERLLRAAPKDDLAVHLYLTRDQERVLGAEPPLLLSGTAGSGKTTIAVYCLLKPEYRGGRRLFVTWSPHLKRFTERLYHALVLHNAVQERSSPPTFVTMRELVSLLLGEPEASVAGYREFERIYRAYALARSFDAELVWEEIRSIIKGARPVVSARRLGGLARAWLDGAGGPRELQELQETLLEVRKLHAFRDLRRRFPDYDDRVRDLGRRGPDDTGRDLLAQAAEMARRGGTGLDARLLSLEEYQALGARRAPNFRYDRKAIHEIALYYQERLAAGGAEDDVDRARRALAALESGRTLYDLVVCDEVQDLCEIETTLLLRLARNRGGVVLAGDLRQSINPSGFRWEEIRRAFYERGQTPPEVVELGLNFRCVGSVVRLANALLELKARLVGLGSTEKPEEWKFNGNPPVLVAGPSEAGLLAEMSMKVAGRIAITRTPEEKKRLGELLGSELVFTIYEAKGLEFDTVLLWRFLEDAAPAALWRRVLSSGTVEREHEPHLRQEFSLLYVALTRARAGLVIYEGVEACPLWEHALLARHVFRTADPAECARLGRRTSTPEEWAEQGEYFEEREHWKAAEECYRNAGLEGRAEVARARGLAAEGRPAEAAPLYAANGKAREAAACWEEAGELERAMDLWKELGEGEKFRRCRVRLYESRGEHAKAAEEWERLGGREDALRCWEAAGRWDRVGAIWSEWKQYRRAAEAFARGRHDLEAAQAWEKAREPRRAADHYRGARKWDLAAALYRKAGDEDRVLECLTRLSDHAGVAQILERRGDLTGALAALRRLVSASVQDAERLRAEMESAEVGRATPRKRRLAGLRAAALGLHARAAEHFEAAGEPDLAVAEWDQAGDPVGVARVEAERGRPAEAARHLERHAPSERELIQGYLRRSVEGAGEHDRARVDALWREAERMERSGNLEGALARYRLFGDLDRLVELYLRLDHDEEALERLLSEEELAAAQRFLERKATLRVSGAFATARVDGCIAEAGDSGDTRPWQVCALLVTRALDAGLDVGAAAERLLDSVPRYGWKTEDSTPVEHLALRRAHGTALLNLLGAGLLGRHWLESPEKRTEQAPLLARIRAAAEASGDPVLRACHDMVHDPVRFEAALAGIPLESGTVGLFEVSRRHHGRAVEWRTKGGDTDRACLLLRIWDEWMEAAALEEKVGDISGACRIYRDQKMPEKALECARRAGDEVEMARSWEALREYRKALDLWSSLGRKRDVERILKKLGEDPTPAR